MILAEWTYTREEWKAFLNSTQKRKGLRRRLLILLFTLNKRSPIPEIIISSGIIMIGELHYPFNGDHYALKNVDIRDERSVNIIALSYTRSGQDSTGEIRVPIPKGKLREAMEIQEKLRPG